MAKTSLGKYFTPKIIINLSIIVGFLIMVSWLLTSLAGEIEKKAESIQLQNLEISARIQAISDLAELRVEAERAKPIVDELNNALPKRDELVAFPRYLDSIARDNSLQLDFKFVGATQDPGLDQAGNSEFVINVLGGKR
jgi:Tfp pilus assembly protein PilO